MTKQINTASIRRAAPLVRLGPSRDYCNESDGSESSGLCPVLLFSLVLMLSTWTAAAMREPRVVDPDAKVPQCLNPCEWAIASDAIAPGDRSTPPLRAGKTRPQDKCATDSHTSLDSPERRANQQSSGTGTRRAAGVTDGTFVAQLDSCL